MTTRQISELAAMVRARRPDMTGKWDHLYNLGLPHLRPDVEAASLAALEEVLPGLTAAWYAAKETE